MKTPSTNSKSVKKLTVLLLDHHLASEKTLQIPKKMWLYWRHFAVAIIALFLMLAGLTFLFANKLHMLYEDKELLEEKLGLIEATDKASDMRKMKQKVEKIETQLKKVNAYLKGRGVTANVVSPKLVSGGKGGESLALTEDNIGEVLDNYGFYLDSLHRELPNIPLGRPVEGPLTSEYGVRPNPFNAAGYEVHPGVDIKAERGEPVKVPANGTVVFAGWKGGYGNCVVIRHSYGYETLYGHLSGIRAEVGQQVNVGDVIGLVGSTGRSTGPHLHYEISRQGKRLNSAVFF